jgi:hypothetical protein
MTNAERKARFEKRVNEESERKPNQVKMADEIRRLKNRIKELEGK